MSVIEIRQYIDRKGRNPFEDWFKGLEATVRARITTCLERLEQGNLSAAKGVGAGVFELRMNFGPGYRMYFGKDGERVVILLSGGTKKRQEIDIERAKLFWKNYKQRKREEECH